MAADAIEWIRDGEKAVALVLRAGHKPGETTFLTPPELTQQLGLIVYGAGSAIPAHFHRPAPRQLVGTSEVIVVRSGRCLVNFYSKERRLVATREMAPGDVVLIFDCGHGFRMLEDTVLLEIKQGPYAGVEERERFQP
jgi:hypothetical protein